MKIELQGVLTVIGGCSLCIGLSIFMFYPNSMFVKGSGCATSGREMSLCLGRLGSNPGSDFGFFQFRIAVNQFSLGVGLFLLTYNRMVHTCSAFLFPIII